MTDVELEEAFYKLMEDDPNFQSESIHTQSWCVKEFILGYRKREREAPSSPGGIDPYSGGKEFES